jgi:hypothetical protein
MSTLGSTTVITVSQQQIPQNSADGIPTLRKRQTAKHVARFEVVQRAVRRYYW